VSASAKTVSLPEKDYLAILDLINKFNGCNKRDDLKMVVQSSLLPLFNAQSALYGCIDPDFSNFTLIDSVHMTDRELNAVLQFIPYDPLAKKVAQTGLPVMAYDVDIPRNKLHEGSQVFFNQQPDHTSDLQSYLKKYKTGMVMRDPLDPNLGLGIHRHIPQPLTHRDVRVLELLTPHILHTLKTIVLREELSKYQSLGEVLADVPNPIALIKENSQIIFCNRAFEKFLHLKTGQRLTEELTSVLQKEISRYDPPFDIDDSKMQIPFYKLGSDFYRLNITRLEMGSPQEGDRWLLRVKPVIEPYSKMNIMMQEAGLTGREMEVSCLIRDGFDNKEIADRLFISVHTLKNHVRHIHQKMSVHTRAQLVALLNKQAEELG
jgi:DNA-binding CsgD family transcriptional regulator